jgi:hypothetical protein
MLIREMCYRLISYIEILVILSERNVEILGSVLSPVLYFRYWAFKTSSNVTGDRNKSRSSELVVRMLTMRGLFKHKW